MPRHRRWSTIIGALLLAVLLLPGCSVLRLAYDQAPSLAYWRLDGDLHLDEPQSRIARAAIAEWFDWHRRVELPAYADFLRTVQEGIGDELDGAQACGWWGEARAALARSLEAATPGIARLAVTLTPQQVQRLAHRQQERREEWRSEVEADDAHERRLRRVLARVQRLYGPLDAAQRARLDTLLRETPWDDEAWLAQRRKRDDLLVMVLRKATHLDEARATALLERTMHGLFEAPDPAMRRAALQLRRGCDVAAGVHNLTTPAQREAARARLRDWEEDLRRLAAR